MTTLKTLFQELESLKKKLFKGSNFIEVDDQDPDQVRYNQLLGLFRPEFRTTTWQDPRDQEKTPGPTPEDIYFLKDQLLNTWELSTPEELYNHVLSQCNSLPTHPTKSLVEAWYSDYMARSKADLDGDYLDTFVRKYINF